MTELLEGGPPEDRRPWPTALVVSVMVLVLVVAVIHQLSSGARPSATPTPSLSLRPTSLPSDLSPLPADAVSPEPSSAVHPRLVGVPLRSPTGVDLVLGGAQLIGVGSGTAGLGSVPAHPGERVTGVRRLAAGLLVTVSIGDGQSEPQASVYLVRKGAPTRLLTQTDAAFPAADGKSIFALAYAANDSAPNVVTRVDLSGRVLARHELPARSLLEGDTVAGLLVQQLGAGDDSLSTLILLDRDTFAVRKELGRIGWVVSSTPTLAAWTDSRCLTVCHLVVTDLTSGRRRLLTAEPGFTVSVVAFSPDGKRVAVAYYGRHAQMPGGSAAGFVDVVELATGTGHRVPGVATDVKQAADLSWTPDGRWLAIAVGITDEGSRTVGLWPTGGGAVQIVRSRVPGAYTEGALLAL